GLAAQPLVEAGKLALMWTLFQLALGLTAGMGGLGIAIWAHVGGFLAGLAWVLAHLRPEPRPSA
ncbi:MAG: rhomboid family intramembrane serine protease, partial [Sphingomonadaceae bacterium]